jgi:hypothetical protein
MPRIRKLDAEEVASFRGSTTSAATATVATTAAAPIVASPPAEAATHHTTGVAPKANTPTRVGPSQMRQTLPERNTKRRSSSPITPAGTDDTQPRPMESRSPQRGTLPRAVQAPVPVLPSASPATETTTSLSMPHADALTRVAPVTTQAQPSASAERERDVPQEAVVALRPVELLLAERRGDVVHLTLGVGITLCGVTCEEAPQPGRSYIAAAGCQRCARMAHQLQARCTSCGRLALHLTGTGACVKCGHAHISIRLP